MAEAAEMPYLFSTYSAFREYMVRHGYLSDFEGSNDIENFGAGCGGAIIMDHYVYRTQVLYNEYSAAVVFSLLVVVVIWIVSKWPLNSKYDSREPPVIQPKVPYIGHILGMYRHGARYFNIVNQKHQYPIYTLPTLNGRLVIVTSPALAAIIQRSSKATSFYSIALEVTRRLCGFDKPSMEIILHNINGEEKDEGLMSESHDMVARMLGPGPILNSLAQEQLAIFPESLGSLSPGTGETAVDLYAWVKYLLTIANAKSIYGPDNFFSLNPELVNDFWAYEEQMVPILADFFPTITARKPYFARQRVLDGMTEYIEKERYKKASLLIQQRVAINLKHGLSKEMSGHAELIMFFAVVGNAVPTTFWLLVNLFSRPELLAEVRGEIEKAVTITSSEDREHSDTRTVHVEIFKSCAPVLLSTYRETLRVVANLSSVRKVLCDTLIADRYLLRKDSVVQIASGVIHTDPSIWGSDAADFNPKRFLTTTSESSFSSARVTEKTSTVPLPPNVPSAAFRAFGGGSVICPGRHFAQTEIVGFVAAVVMGFELEKEGGGVIEVPERDDGKIPIAVMKPETKCRVVIRRRKGLERVKWELEL